MEKMQVTIRLPENTKTRIEKEADARGVSFNEMVNSILYDFLERITKDQPEG